MAENTQDSYKTLIPTRWIGPLKISGEYLDQALIEVPLATYETTLWPSSARGAKLSRLCPAGIQCVITQDNMTRSVLLQANDANSAQLAQQAILAQQDALARAMQASSRFLSLQNIHIEQVGRLLYIHLQCQCAAAAGHNMTTKAADAAINWILAQQPQLTYISLSANFCCDKKVSAVNGLRGRGKHVIAELMVPAELCQQQLRCSPQQLVDLHIKKNLIGSTLAGSIRSANAHFSNILLAMYLACGQDAANIVEGSQGFTHAELQKNDLYFSVSLPHIIVGSIGHGKDLPHIAHNLQRMQCQAPQLSAADNSRRLAMLIAATTLCAEISLLAALTNRGELMRAHQLYERSSSQKSSHMTKALDE